MPSIGHDGDEEQEDGRGEVAPESETFPVGVDAKKVEAVLGVAS